MNSLWINSVKNNFNFNTLDKDLSTDVCIIGAGIFGLTCAYYLSEKGFKVTILDRNNIMNQVSGHTTAKITSQHNLIYKYLLDSLGIKLAKQYLNANQEAINNIKNIIDIENIDCDYEIQDSYVYTTNKNEIPEIQLENATVNALRF